MAIRTVAQKVPLPNSTCGAHMYAQGFGTWRGEKGIVGEAVVNAIKAGYRLIDCARMYGNEKQIGDAITYCLKEGLVERKDLYIVAKIWNTDHMPKDVLASAKQSIDDLQCTYLDCLLMHWPVAWVHPQDGKMGEQTAFFNLNAETGGSVMADVSISTTYKAMEDLIDAKLVKDIGVSNFSIEDLEALLPECKYTPVANQVEVHPSLPQDELRQYCTSKGIVLMSYKPYGIGGSDISGGLLYNEEIKRIATEVAKVPSAPHLLLQWNCQKGNVALCKSTTPERIATNAAVPFGGLSEETMAAVAAFSAKNKKRLCNPYNFTAKKEDYFKNE